MSQQDRDDMLKRARNIQESDRGGGASPVTGDHLDYHKDGENKGSPERARFGLKQPTGRVWFDVTPASTTDEDSHILNDAEEAHVGKQVKQLEKDLIN